MKAQFKIDGMTCTACAAAIERSLSRQNGVQSAVVNFATEELNVTYQEALISPLDIEETISYLKDLAENVGSHYPSMHQDIANRRPTEIDFLNGAVAEMAREHGTVAPYCQAITDLIHAKEDVLGISKA